MARKKKKKKKKAFAFILKPNRSENFKLIVTRVAIASWSNEDLRTSERRVHVDLLISQVHSV
jgi:hypothetical protein